MRFIAIASVSCASLLIEPKDMAPVAKRFTISEAGFDFFEWNRRTGGLELKHAPEHLKIAVLLVHDVRELAKVSNFDSRTECCSC